MTLTSDFGRWVEPSAKCRDALFAGSRQYWGVGVEWQGVDEVDPECLETLRKVLDPVLLDLEATASGVNFLVDPRPCVGCGCVLLPQGLTWEDVSRRGMKHPDLGPFFAYGWLDVDVTRPPEQLVWLAADEFQRMAIAMIWTRTGIGGWPLCPVHKTHPLWPYPDGDLGIAVWQCRRAGHRIPIGGLSKT